MNPITIEAFDRDQHGALVSSPQAIGAFDGKRCRFQLDGYDGDPYPADFLEAVANVLRAKKSLLLDATPYVQQYCREMIALWGDKAPKLDIKRPEDVWQHVDLGSDLVVSRDHGEGRDVFVSLECHWRGRWSTAFNWSSRTVVR
jgi:hypothetical protein